MALSASPDPGSNPNWFKVVKKLACLQPSSAASERIFSLLQAYFAKGGRRGSSLEDIIELTIQLQYHQRRV